MCYLTLKPLPEDVTGWCAMCFGPLNVQRNPQVSTPDGATGSEEHLRRIGLDPAATCGSPPLLSILTFMDQVCYTIYSHWLSLSICVFFSSSVL